MENATNDQVLAQRIGAIASILNYEARNSTTESEDILEKKRKVKYRKYLIKTIYKTEEGTI